MKTLKFFFMILIVLLGLADGVSAGETASNPSPPDGASCVDPDVYLSWSPGVYADSHEVYFDINKAKVQNRSGCEINGVSCVDPCYPLPSLETNTTYYWAIDEVNNTGPNWPGDVWEFTTVPVAGLGSILVEVWEGISGSDVSDLTSSPRYPDYPDETTEAPMFEDPTGGDNYGTRMHGWLYVWTTNYYTFWIASNDQSELWLSTDDDPENAVLIASVPEWTDPQEWTKYSGQQSYPIPLEAGNMYCIMALHKEGTSDDHLAVAWSTNPDPCNAEVIPGTSLIPYSQKTSFRPSPPDEQTGVAVGANLSWTPGDYAAAHDVYFGTDEAAVNDASRSNPLGVLVKQDLPSVRPYTTYDVANDVNVGILEPNTTYYWRIDDVNEAGPDPCLWVGDVWSFTTFDGTISRAEAFQHILEELDVPNDVWVYGSKYTIDANTTIGTFGKSIQSATFVSWYFFIDDHPWANWAHPCRYVFVDVSTGEIEVLDWRLPPNVMTIMELLQGTLGGTTEPSFWRPSTVFGCESSDRDYAVIISGGGNDYYNWERYWNDCSYIYTTLVHGYKYREDHIYVLISDGTNLGLDRHRNNGTYDSSPLDLDDNGSDDIKYAATKANITKVFDELKEKLDADDFLFIYTTNHGGQESGKDVWLYLWTGYGPQAEYDYITDDEFAAEVDKVKAGQIAIVMEQCHSGGFIDDLSHSSRVIATAARHDEGSSAMPPNYDFDEFVYHWTAAVAGEEPDGTPVDADTNEDGFVSMREAFVYAEGEDTQPETPQYDSQPANFGDGVTLNGVPGPDLMMQDKPWDTGLEPDPATKNDKMYQSEDIVVRHAPDGGTTHLNPEYGSTNYVYVRARNRGCEPVSGTIEVYWTYGAPGVLWPDSWTKIPDEIPVDSLESGHSLYDFVEWSPPGTGHYCLLARFNSPIEDPMTHAETTSHWYNTKYNNNIVWKNVTVVDEINKGDSHYLIVRNTYPEPALINLGLRAPVSELGDTFLDYGDVFIDLGQELFDLWTGNGQQGEGFEIVGPNSLKMLSSDSTLIANIPVDANQEFTVSMRFDLPEDEPPEHAAKYYVNLFQFVRCEEQCTVNCTLIGDINEDCVVDFKDLMIIADNWLTAGYELIGDVHEDWKHRVDLKDFAGLAENWLGVAIDMIGGNTYELRFESMW